MNGSVLSTLPDTKRFWHPATLDPWCYSGFPLNQVFFLNLCSCLAVTRPLFHVTDRWMWKSSISTSSEKLGQVILPLLWCFRGNISWWTDTLLTPWHLIGRVRVTRLSEELWWKLSFSLISQTSQETLHTAASQQEVCQITSPELFPLLCPVVTEITLSLRVEIR